MNSTAFYFDERTMWHVPGGLHALYLPVGGWVQPMAGSGMARELCIGSVWLNIFHLPWNRRSCHPAGGLISGVSFPGGGVFSGRP